MSWLGWGFLFLVALPPIWIAGAQIRLLPDFVAFTLIAFGTERLMTGRSGRIPLIAGVLALLTFTRTLFEVVGGGLPPIETDVPLPVTITSLWILLEFVVWFGALHIVWEVCGAIADRADHHGDERAARAARRGRLGYLGLVVLALVLLSFHWFLAIARAAVWVGEILLTAYGIQAVLHVVVAVGLIRLAFVVKGRFEARAHPPAVIGDPGEAPTARAYR